MDDEQVNGAIDEIERALVAEDPAFVRRQRSTERSVAVNFVVVFVLLAIGAVLLAVGFATTELIPWSIGGVALVTAVLVDDHHQRSLR